MAKVLSAQNETIVALSTAAGRAGIAVVRVSGPSAFALAESVVDRWPIEPRTAVLCRLINPGDGSVIDQGIVIAFPAPRSYTGDDTVELSVHGGAAVSDALISALLYLGARQATPGEFTRRAVLNGKLDLIQAEAVGDLIDATSETMRRVAIHQVDGSLSRQIDDLKNRLLDLEALLAYDIDFPEEDHGPVSRARIGDAAARVQQMLQLLLKTGPTTELARDGAIVVIAGRPNVGKSSLFNALLGEQRAIVTATAGTTRDAIEARLQLNQWPIRLVDTAGLRDTDELVEQLGIEVSERYLKAAHLVLVCDDDVEILARTVETVQSLTSASMVAVLTKADQVALSEGIAADMDTRVAYVSARARQGLSELSREVERILVDRYGAVPTDRPALTRTRQRVAVTNAARELGAFQQQWEAMTLPTAIAAVHVRSAIGALDELIGAIDTEDVLSRVFATFCIGK